MIFYLYDNSTHKYFVVYKNLCIFVISKSKYFLITKLKKFKFKLKKFKLWKNH